MLAKACNNISLLVLLVGGITTCAGSSDDVLFREKRFLIFPRANPGRLQLIGGFGIPVDLQLESITVGYVIKSVYLLPWNSSHWIPQFLDRHEQEVQRAHETYRRDVGSIPFPLLTADRNYERYYEPWHDVANEPLSELATKDSRWTFYRMLEQLFEQKGFNGRSCVLRAICECSDAGFTHTSGLVGELLHIAFTPSTTDDVTGEPHHEVYRQAEHIPWRSSASGGGSICSEMFAECSVSLLDSFSNVFAGRYG